MQWQYNAYTVVLMVTAALSLVTGAAAWQRRPLSGAVAFAFSMGATAQWSFAAGMEAAAIDVSSKILWSQIEYIGMCVCPIFFYVFARSYARPNVDVPRRTVAGISIIPLITWGMAATNEWHGLLWSSFTPTIQSGIHMLIYGHGIWFWINTVYLYALMTVAVVTLISAVAHSDHLYRRQAGAVVFAVVLPLVSGCIYMSGLNPWPGLDLTPIGIVLSGPILAWGLFQLRLFDLVPVARHVLLETMSEGLLVLDVQRRIADVNPAARRLMGIGDERLIGMQVSALPGLWPHVITQHCAETAMETETAVGADGLRCVDMRVTPLCDRHGRVTGHLVVARDISERKRVENALRASSERLQAQLTENEALQCRLHEQAIRDPLTDLFNRRYLEETLVRELARSVRDERPVCVLMFDLDKFKHINDKLGHAAGDAVLQAVGQVLASRTRRGDVACRYGGDEFVVVLPATDLESACYRANELLDAVDALRIPYTERILVTKASCGIAAFPEHSQTGDDLLRLTDRALYMAKARGGGCVVMFGERHELVRWT